MEEKQSKQNDSEEYYCEECNADVSIDDKVCPKCGSDLSDVEEEIEDGDENRDELSVNYQFKTLLGYGKFISGLGWVVLIAGIALIITSFFYLSGGGS